MIKILILKMYLNFKMTFIFVFEAIAVKCLDKIEIQLSKCSKNHQVVNVIKFDITFFKRYLKMIWGTTTNIT